MYQIAAQTFVREKKYGLAVSYCTSAEDWPGLGRIVDLVLDEYIFQGTSCRVRISTLPPLTQPCSRFAPLPLQARTSLPSSLRT